MPIDFQQQVIEEFRANNGRVGGYFEGARLILLTSTGAQTGTRHTTPLAFLPDGGERILVIGSAGGSPKHPDWYYNVLAHPIVTVEDGVFTYDAEAVVLQGRERDQAFARAVEADRGWADYEAKASRTLPVVALKEVSSGPPNASSFAEALRLIHNAFRREIGLIRKEIAESGPGLGAQLRINCLTLCKGLHVHHTHEDAGMFPALAERFPELAPTIDRLSAEHEQIAALIEALQKVISTPSTDLAAVREEANRLADALEAHLTYEEDQLIPLLELA